MPAAPNATPERIKDVNTRYHDVAAETYDSKWGIDFGATGQHQVRSKILKSLGKQAPSHFPDALEIGAGTGYFSLNMLRLGMVGKVTATDISPGMLATLEQSAERLGLEVETVACEAEHLPFPDESFDLVFGHAVLHHIPDLDRAMAEFKRVLRPGGMIAFCGEPSRYGDRLAAVPKKAGLLIAPLWRAAVRAAPLSDEVGGNSNGGSAPADVDHANGHDHADGHELEGEVDVHAFAPADLRRLLGSAGFEQSRLQGEELLSNMYGWGLRTVESTARPEDVPMGWRMFAFRSFITLQKLDAAVLEPRLPAELFYNLVLSGRKPA